MLLCRNPRLSPSDGTQASIDRKALSVTDNHPDCASHAGDLGPRANDNNYSSNLNAGTEKVSQSTDSNSDLRQELGAKSASSLDQASPEGRLAGKQLDERGR